METHFEGSRGSEHMTSPHQRQYDEQNPDNANVAETDQTDRSQNKDEASEVDSPINTSVPTEKNGGSLTNDESASANPDDADKPEFDNSNNKR